MDTTTTGARRHAVIAISASLLVIAGLAGCTNGTTVVSPPMSTAPAKVSTSTPSASTPMPAPAVSAPVASTTPSPVASVPAASDPTGPSAWTITFTGVGPLTVGGSQTVEAKQMVDFTTEGHQQLGEGRTCPADFFHPKTAGPGFVTTYGRVPDKTTVISMQTDYSAAVSAAEKTASPKTAAGIGIGSTLTDLKAAYPTITRAGDIGPIATYYSMTDGQGRWLDFGISEKQQVVEITLADGKMPPYEYCG